MIKYCWLLVLSYVLSGCVASSHCHTPIMVPCEWLSPTTPAVPTEPSACLVWWESVKDPLLNELIDHAMENNFDLLMARESDEEDFDIAKALVAAEVSKSYSELRGLQIRLEGIDKHIASQKEAMQLTRDLMTNGFTDKIDQKLAEEELSQLLAQKPLLESSSFHTLSHLSTLLGHPSLDLCETLTQRAALPLLPCNIPIGKPAGLLERSPAARKAARQLAQAKSVGGKRARLALYNYQKTVLKVLETAEKAIASLHFSWKRNLELARAYRQSLEVYQLLHQLYEKGLKSYPELLIAQRSLMTTEDSYVQSQVQLLHDYIALNQALSK